MLYAWINGEKRQPLEKGERTVCKGCGGELRAILPLENVRHWRHKGGDCDSWSETEGEWHVWWKEQFPLECREISLRDEKTGELHRADVLCEVTPGKGVVLELQQSAISDEERVARERFYTQKHKMYWLLNMHDPNSFRAFSFGISLDFSRPIEFANRTFFQMHWLGNSRQFIEKWKKSSTHVFLNYDSQIFYLATPRACNPLVLKQERGDFAIAKLTLEEFKTAVMNR